MRLVAFAALAVLLAGCSWSPVLMYGHVSDPSQGPPFTERCEDVADFGGAGMGQSWDHDRGNTRVYVVGGAKRFRVCPDDMTRPANVRHEPAGTLLVIREFDRR